MARIMGKEEYLTSCGIPAKSFRMIDLDAVMADPFYNHKSAGGVRLRVFGEMARLCRWETTTSEIRVLNGVIDKITLQKGERWFRGRSVAKKLRISRAALRRVLESGEKAAQWTLKTGPLYSVISLEKHLLFPGRSQKPAHLALKTGPRIKPTLIERSGKYFSLEGRRRGEGKKRSVSGEAKETMSVEMRRQVEDLKARLSLVPKVPDAG